MGRIFIEWAGPIYQISEGRYCFYFEMHKWCGPMRVDSDGEPENDGIFPERSPFWGMFQRWSEQGKRLNGKDCILD